MCIQVSVASTLTAVASLGLSVIVAGSGAAEIRNLYQLDERCAVTPRAHASAPAPDLLS